MRDAIPIGWSPLVFVPSPRPHTRDHIRKVARESGLLAGNAAMACAGLALAYGVKRALGLDLVPGVDMLPDEDIRALLALLLG